MTFLRWTAKASGVPVARMKALAARRWAELVEAYGLGQEVP